MKKKFIDKPEFQEMRRAKMSPLQIALEKHCITVDALAKQLAEELEATETKAFKSRGESVEYSKPLIAWNIRQRAREDAQKLLGLYPAEEHKITGDFNESMTKEEKEMFRAIAKEIAEKVKAGK